MLNNELRENSVHLKCVGPVEYFTDTITLTKTITDYLIMMVIDCRSDAKPLWPEMLNNDNVFFVNNRNPRKEPTQDGAITPSSTRSMRA